jgi:hypothetical protein
MELKNLRQDRKERQEKPLLIFSWCLGALCGLGAIPEPGRRARHARST